MVLLLIFLVSTLTFCGQNIALSFDFSCNDGHLIPQEHFCDGQQDCTDKRDEKYHKTKGNSLAKWQRCYPCNNQLNNYTGSCLIERDLVCKVEISCQDLTPCDLDCDSHYKCQNSDSCMPRATVCNGDMCDGCPESHEWKNGIVFKCRKNGKECVLPQQLLRDVIPDCDDGIDLCFGSMRPLNSITRYKHQPRANLFLDKCFMCLDDITVIPLTGVCNGIIDCPDLSDECLCEGKRPEVCDSVIKYNSQTTKSGIISTKDESMNDSEDSGDGDSKQKILKDCGIGYVKCKNGKCISRRSICDGVKDCEDDEKFDFCGGTISCKDAIRYEQVQCRCSPFFFSCSNSYGSACNGVADCPSGMMFISTSSGYNPFPEDECEASCDNDSTNYQCGGVAPSRYLCESSLLQPESSGNLLEYNYIDGESVCDGKIDCLRGDDERNCTNRFKCDTKQDGFISIQMEKTCDGIEDCKNGTDENRVFCNNTRFYCHSGENMSIDKKYVCDYLFNCDDGSDEKNCSDDRVYCENGDPLFVRSKKRFDGVGDCTDWTDECPSQNHDPSNKFTSAYNLIESPWLRAVVWTLGILSVFGNATIIYREVAMLRIKKKLPANLLINKILIANLACSDFIMGIYLIALGMKGAIMQKNYCRFDLSWRSSSACSTLGVLSVLSKEGAVMTLVLLSGCRLYGIYKPLEAKIPRRKPVFFTILSAWIIALLFALIPLSPYASSTFIMHAQLKYSPFSQNAKISLDSARELFDRLMTYDLKSNVTDPENLLIENSSWSDLETYGEKYFLHNHFSIVRKFGFYSSTSVCAPKFFPSTRDRSWSFSLFMTAFNMLSFLFMASAYIVIYSSSNKILKIRSAKSNEDGYFENMQKKIFIVIISNFVFWIPVCIIAFRTLVGAEFSFLAYDVSAIILMPINSALNPLILFELPNAWCKDLKKHLNFDRQILSEDKRHENAIKYDTMTTPKSENIHLPDLKGKNAESRL